MVFQGSRLNWRRRVGVVCHWYICILLYVRLIWCSGFPDMYAQMEEFGGVSLSWVYMHSSTCENYLV